MQYVQHKTKQPPSHLKPAYSMEERWRRGQAPRSLFEKALTAKGQHTDMEQPAPAELSILLCMLQIFLKLDSCRGFVGLLVLQKQNPFLCTYARDL